MRILVIEDDVDLTQFLCRGLQEEQHTVETATDGETGLILATDESYDLLIVDVMLPKLDGLALCKRLRAKGNRTPILLLTARDSVEDKVTGLDAGADDYLTKPFAFTELVARTRAPFQHGCVHGRPGHHRTTLPNDRPVQCQHMDRMRYLPQFLHPLIGQLSASRYDDLMVRAL